MIHFELIFVKSVKSVSGFIFLHEDVCSVVPTQFVEDTIFAPLHCLSSFVKGLLIIFTRVYFSALYSVPLIDLFFHQHHTLFFLINSYFLSFFLSSFLSLFIYSCVGSSFRVRAFS